MDEDRGTIHTISCEDALVFVCDAHWGFALKDAAGRYTWANKAFCDCLNAPPELILGTRARDWTHPDDIAIDEAMAVQVASGEIPGYTLAKRYIQRGSTPQKPRVLWGTLSVFGKWKDGRFAGYQIQFRPYSQTDPKPGWSFLPAGENWSRLLPIVAKWIVSNWKTIVVVATVSMSLILGGSRQLLDAIAEAQKVKESVDGALDSLSPGQSAVPP